MRAMPMIELGLHQERSLARPRRSASAPSGGFFDYDAKNERLEEVVGELEDPDVWNEARTRAGAGPRARASSTTELEQLDRAHGRPSTTAIELLELAEAEDDAADRRATSSASCRSVEAQVRKLEFKRMFRGEMDSHNAFLDIQAGAGGTEAQDWAQMLMRMYLRWAATRGFKTEVIEAQRRRSRRHQERDHRTSTATTPTAGCAPRLGVHRLVRKSPFDSGNRRHTSFASVFVSPEIDDDIDIDINPADLRDRRVPLERRRRPARQQDRVGGAHHAHARRASSWPARTSAASTRTAPPR